MGIEEFLDLARIDVLAAADDHVFDPADDVAVAVLVHDRKVAGMHPAAASMASAAPPHRPSSRASPSSRGSAARPLARRDDRPSRIDDLDLHIGLDAADGGDPQFDRIVGRSGR